MTTLHQTLLTLRDIDGLLGAALVDSETGLCIDWIGASDSFDLEAAAAVHSRMIKLNADQLRPLRIHGPVEELVITVEEQVHFMRPLQSRPSWFVYVVADRAACNAALAKHRMCATAFDLSRLVASRRSTTFLAVVPAV